MQAAYKMKEASAKAPKLEVRRGDASRRAAARRQNMARGLLALTMLALVCAVIYSHVQLTELTGEILKVIRDLAAEHMTMVIVTHEMGFARDVADHLIFMDGGVIVEQGPASEVINNPQHDRTRAFLANYDRD